MWDCAHFSLIYTLLCETVLAETCLAKTNNHPEETDALSLFRRPRHRFRSRKTRGIRRLVFARASAGRRQIIKSFGAEKAWRFWSLTDPSQHQATYQFADRAALDRAASSEDLKRLVADFDRDWPGVTRTRELLVLAEELSAG